MKPATRPTLFLRMVAVLPQVHPSTGRSRPSQARTSTVRMERFKSGLPDTGTHQELAMWQIPFLSAYLV